VREGSIGRHEKSKRSNIQEEDNYNEAAVSHPDLKG
jgi:hypothetical protein